MDITARVQKTTEINRRFHVIAQEHEDAGGGIGRITDNDAKPQGTPGISHGNRDSPVAFLNLSGAVFYEGRGHGLLYGLFLGKKVLLPPRRDGFFVGYAIAVQGDLAITGAG
jgi:hypothetical protein